MSLVIALKYRPVGIVSSAEIFLRVYGTMNMTYTRVVDPPNKQLNQLKLTHKSNISTNTLPNINKNYYFVYIV